MSSMMDRGDSYHVIYLGSCMMSQVSTGLGVLQKPLKDLYLKYRQPGGGPAAQERYLVMSSRGMTVSFKESGASHPTEIFYGVPHILFWDAVRFVTVRGSKKVMCAFEPLDNDHSRNKDNLFSVLEKTGQFLQQMTHPPIFTCVLRRTSGVKALDVHAFVCSSDEEALGIVSALNTIYDNFSADEVHETGVFGYKPFGYSVTAGSTRAVGEVRRHVATVFGEQPVSRSSSLRNLPMELSLAHSSSTNSSSSSSAASSHNQRQSPYTGRPPPVGGAGIQLSQDHFQPTRRSDVDLSRDSPLTSPTDHVYQSLPHDDDHRPCKPLGRAEPRLGLRDYHSISRSVENIDESLKKSNNNFIQQNLQRTESQSVKDLSNSRIARQVLPSTPAKRPGQGAVSSKLGQGYSLLSGSASPLPGQETGDYGREYEPPPLPPPRSGSPYSSGIPRPSLLPQFGGRDSRAADLPPHYRDLYSPHSTPSTPSSPYERPYSRLDMRHHQSPPSKTPEVQSRPVAKVPPHKITGVRVLPSSAGMFPVRSSPDGGPELYSPPDGRPKSSNYDDMDYITPKNKHNFGPPPQRTKSQHLYGEKKGKDNRFDVNWQFKPNQHGEDYEYSSKQKEGDDSVMNEKLLMNQKKDAEIAAVMQNLRFDYDGSTITPGVPAGNNFEKSLGYFP